MACSGCDESVYSGTDWGKQIECLRCEIESLRDTIKESSQAASEFSQKLKASGNVAKAMAQEISEMRQRMYEFTKDTAKQYDLAEKIAESYKSTALQIGLSVGRAKDFSNAFKGSVAAVAKFGGDLDDVQGIYTEFAEQSGRVRILGEDEVENIFKLGKAANLVGSEATALYETLDLMGVSNLDATERMNELIKDSQKVGLNSSMVVKTLSTNLNKMQTYSFSNGVKGMTEMAKLAVKMRMDVGEMLSMAEKFYEPEAAIEAASNLQMLGGDIANAFGDPFETMYLARNKPEELAKKVGTMVENMMQFNQETGEYEFPAEARMQLKAAGDQLGINVDSMIEMTRQANKIKDVKDKLSMKGMFSEDEMEGIASMARLEGGEFKVDVYDEDGKKITKSLDELSSGDVEMLMRVPDDEKDYQTQMINQSMTTNEHLKAIEDAFQKTFIKGIDVYQISEESTKKSIDATREMTLNATASLIEEAKKSLLGGMGSLGKDALMTADEKLAESIKGIENFIIDKPTVEMRGGEIIFSEGVTSANVSQMNGGKNSSANIPILQQRDEWCKNNGYPGGYDENTNMCVGGGQVPFAKGGIVTKPTNALIGEGNEPEAVFPLSKLENFLESKMTGGNITLDGTANINITISSDNPNIEFSSEDSRKMKDSIIRTVTAMFNNGGSPDGANIPQGSKGFIQTM